MLAASAGDSKLSEKWLRMARGGAYHTGFEFWRLAIEDVCWLDAIFDDSDCAIEKSHEVTAVRTLGGVRARGE